MIIGVILFLLLVSSLTFIASWAADEALRRLGRPTRWVWLAGLAAPFVLLLAPRLLPEGSSAALAVAPAQARIFELAPIIVGEGEGALLAALPLVLGGLWALSSLGFALHLIRVHYRLLRDRAGWSVSRVAGRDIYLSEDRGPAVAGLVEPWIVLPRWSLTLSRRELDFVVLHEEEHIRARDTVLLSASLALVALAPWNPLAWLHLRKLKTAMEIDCDRRVLSRAPDRAAYGDSLLAVAARSSGLSLGLAAFTEKRRSLETRILTMTETPTRRTVVRSTLFLLVAGVVAIQACIVESPILVSDDQEGEASEAAEPEVDLPPPPTEALDRVGAASQGEARGEPFFTPFTVAPRIVNRAEVVEAMQREYPPLLRDAGIGGTVAVYFFIDEEGAVGDVRISESSGHEALDRAAVAVADVFRFTPASNDDKPTAVWVSFPITFQAH